MAVATMTTSTLALVLCFATSMHAATTTTKPETPQPTTPTVTSKPASITKLCPEPNPLSQTDIDTKISTLQGTFDRNDYKRPLDLIFVVDRSQSIGSESFNETKLTIEKLITKFAELKYIFVHRNYTRVGVISFAGDATVDLNGLSPKSIIDACLVNERVTALKVEAYQGKSFIIEALERAKEEFTQSRSEKGRSDVTQVLWLFNDGECADPENCVNYSETLKADTKGLRDDKITIFTSGIGEWLDSQEKVNNLKTIASSADHYACANTWLEIFPKLKLPVSDAVNTVPVFSEIADVYKPRCGTCAKGLECACDVITRDYVCTDKPKVMIKAANTTIIIKEKGPAWVMPVAIGSSIAGGILLLILLITLPLMAVRKKRAKEEERQFFANQPIYGGPLLPPPPVLRAPRIDPRNKDNVYANRDSNNTYSTYGDNTELDNAKEYMAIPYPQDYLEVEEKLENEMSGWPGTLTTIKQSNRLLHLSVRSVSSGRWAHTSGAALVEKDFKELEKVMRQNKYTPHMKIKIASKVYEVDKENLSNIQIHGTRFVQKGIKEVLWAFKVYDYVIVGIAHQTEDGDCVRAVHEIHRHLLSMISSDPGNIKSKDIVEEGIYSCVLPERYSRINGGFEGFDPPE